MPPKIRELIAELERKGFVNRGGKGSHRNFKHPKYPQPVRISGKTGRRREKLLNKTGAGRFERSEREMRKESDLYKKIVYWSDEDDCFIGMCPELMFGGVHGSDPLKVFMELNEAVEEVIEIYKEDGTDLAQ